MAVIDLAVKAVAQRPSRTTKIVDLGPLDLRPRFDSGAAFSLGGRATQLGGHRCDRLHHRGHRLARLAVSRHRPAALLVGLSAVLAEAVGNLADRASDGVVTDYLHSGWWPTFNLADVLITLGALTFALGVPREDVAPTPEVLRQPRHRTRSLVHHPSLRPLTPSPFGPPGTPAQ